MRQREDDIEGTCNLTELVEPTPTILIAVYGPRERKDAPKYQLGHIDPGLSTVGREPHVRDKDQSKGQGTVAERPPEVFREHTLERERVYQDASDTTQLDGSSGERSYNQRTYLY